MQIRDASTAHCELITLGMHDMQWKGKSKPQEPQRVGWQGLSRLSSCEKSISPMVWWRILSPPKSLLFGQPGHTAQDISHGTDMILWVALGVGA